MSTTSTTSALSAPGAPGALAPAPRPVLAGIPAYVPKPPAPPAEGPSHRLFLNENPYPPLPSVRETIARAAAQTNHYPTIHPERLMDALARRLDVPPGHLVTGPGSVGIYQQIGQAMLEPGDEVVYAWPSFEAYPIVARMAGAVPVEVPLVDGVHDLDAMAAAITPRTRAVFLCEPNNPTGTAVGTAELKRFLDRVPGDVLVVLDEAYFEFSRSPNASDGVELHHDRPNLLTLRTFSKAYGLAGLRVGYGVAQPAIAGALRKCAVPCGVGRIAEEAALTALRVRAELFERVERIVAERERTREALLGLGWEVLPSEANFLWLPAGEASESVAEEWERRGLLVRAFPRSGLRVTVGSPEVNDLLITAAAQTAPPSR
ncbi:histidinol-phosphate transaminase [Streptomyces sp. TRM 70361]|uniref:histidinol-phosphate transaminase n=1 Tax=Streptomyces sp. TRM 70361 TaxID=3116553 RepID=UPI002E7C4A0D|nr:histidinol-phosphate transaminase [Streptomyces sp. TRM 70361]MEE1938777.1 histidinol-phosphate transaminase [Streptomyces sp. TRM 70361]